MSRPRVVVSWSDALLHEHLKPVMGNSPDETPARRRIKLPEGLLKRPSALDSKPTAPHLDALMGESLVTLADEQGSDEWRVADSFEGTQILGGTGSGKTSGSGREIAYAFLLKGYGGLILTAKAEERERWETYWHHSKRPDSLIVVEPQGRFRLNFLDYEFQTSSGSQLTQNLVALFMTAMSPGGGAAVASDPYWDDALRQMLTHAIDLVALANGKVTLQDLASVIRDAPQSAADSHSKTWQNASACWTMLGQAQERTTDAARREDLADTVEYWLNDFAKLSERTRSVVVSSFTSKATGLLRSPLRELFCTDTTVRPEDTFLGRVVLLHLPIKDFGEVGRFAQVLFKTVWQRAGESSRRDLSLPDARPAFLWADESQYFVTHEDMLFQTTARSKMLATVYLTQSLSNYYAVLNTRGGTAATDSLLGNLVTKIFHANGDPVTNEWAERVFGHTKKAVFGATQGHGQPSSQNLHFAFEPSVPASSFTTLKKGGKHSQPPFLVTAKCFQGGRIWSNKRTDRDASFDQTRHP